MTANVRKPDWKKVFGDYRRAGENKCESRTRERERREILKLECEVQIAHSCATS